MSTAPASALSLSQSLPFLPSRIPQRDEYFDETSKISPDDKPAITETP
jgi:hypothetical protein